ncbi:MAG: polyprenyl synthetase family protein [Pirellulaceae bacterium]
MTSQTTFDLQRELHPMREAVESAMDTYTAAIAGCPTRLTDAIRYSALAPGKRLRPLLTLLACDAVGADWQIALPAACAVEFVHVYSLIHDDLPAMDNDDMRRGKPTCHVRFDEATAILAGDSLQMLAIETLCNGLPNDTAVACCRLLSRAAGRQALVGGQADDLSAEGRFGPLPQQQSDPLEFLKSIHRRKTSALIEVSLQLGGVAGGASLDHLRCLENYGRAVGLAFQIVDDCLDVESTAEQMGKKTRKDSELGKMTYPSLLGLEASRKMAKDLICEACEAIAVLKNGGRRLATLAQFVVERRN